MFWIFLSIAFIAILAWLMRKAVKGTVFAHRCPCTPYIEHLRWREKGASLPKGQKNEQLW